VLGLFGADVIHIESATHPDGQRTMSLRALTEDLWWEWAPNFHGPNANKRGLTLNMQTRRGYELALKLIATCDIIVENYTPRVLEQWGLTYERLCEVKPDIIMLRLPSFGLDGPWRDATGYAQTQEQVSGLAYVTGYADEDPQVPNGPCDPIAGLHATIALLQALEHRRKTGEGMEVEVPMVGGALQLAAEQVIEYSSYGTVMERMGNRSVTAVPQGVYSAKRADGSRSGERFVAISVETDAQWRAFSLIIGHPEWATSPQYESAADRRARHDELDIVIDAWTASYDVETIVERLTAAGIPAAALVQEHEQSKVPPVRERGYFESVTHSITGTNVYSGFPVRLSNGPHRLIRRPAPMLGEHNHEILAELGVSEEEIIELEREGVIGNRVVGSTLSATAARFDLAEQ
jgi:crotonobetainyl-CoA:carnitine CoA-transferase CaiB-like acyl-CoA transferase